MSKRKWYTRALYTIVALAMTVGLLMVPAAVADPAVVQIDGCLREVHVTTTFANADWATTPVKYVGGSSAELTDGDEAYEEAAVLMCYTGALSTLTTALAAGTYEYWISTTAAHDMSAVLYVDTDGDGFADVILHSTNIPCGGGGAAFAAYAPTDNWAAKNVNVANPTYPGFGMWWSDATSGYTEATAGTATYKALAAWAAVGGIDQTDAVLCVGAATVGVVTTNTYYVDGIDIGTAEYDLEPGDCGVWLEPDIAYNVKTADETFTVMDCCGPVSAAYVYDWIVTKGAGEGDVSVTPGTGINGVNYITVRMVTKGDCIISAMIDIQGDDDPSNDIEVNAEKKWGEIYCTELVKGAAVDHDYLVTETVKASFLEVVSPQVADDAKVDWWLMKIGAQAAIEALEAALGDDPCDDDGGCGIYEIDFFQYDLDADGTIETHEKYDSPGEALLAIYAKYELIGLKGANHIVGAAPDATHTTTFSNELGITTVTVHTEAPTSVILVTLTDYPRDKNGENAVCVQHETWVVTPPPFHEKLPNILWAGEKDVIEWRLPEGSDEYTEVVFYLEDPSVGTFETLCPGGVAPDPGFAIRDTAWGLVEYEICGDYYVARTVLHSDKQGKSNVVAVLFDEYDDIVAQQGFLVYFLAFEDVELVNLDEDVDNDEAWTEAGETTSVLDVGDESLLRLRVKGFFEDPVMKSPRLEKPQDLDGDGTTDIILPAGRWVLPDDYPTLALGKLLWDMMDTPIDDIVSWLDEDGDQKETVGGEFTDWPLLGTDPFGAYGDEACFESPLDDTTLTGAQRWAAYLEGVVSFGPVIGPFSKLEPINADGTAWAAFEDTTQIQPDVPADDNQIDAWVEGLVEISTPCRTTVVPDGLITTEDANMPPAEILFVVTDGAGDLTDVNKADLYYRDADCVFGTDSVDGEVYTNPYYWQEIPANEIIPPMYGTGLAGYEWDSWDVAADDPDIDGPYRFWDELDVWTSDELIAMNILDLTAVPPVVKVYTDNHGEAWVEFEQESFDASIIQAIATYPYLIGDHLPLVSNPVIKLSENLKRVEVYVDDLDPVDPIRKMLYVFVRNYDGTPADCELVEWIIDGPYGIIEALLEGTCDACTNACYPVDYWDCEDCYIWLDGRSAASCTRDMTAAEITEFAAEVAELSDEVGEEAADYAIAGLVILSSHQEDVDVSITIHDCWQDTIVIWPEDQMVTWTVDDPAVEVGLATIMEPVNYLVMVYGYKAGEGVEGWTVFNPEWAVTHPEWNTLTTLYQGRGYWLEVNAACTLTYENQSYDLDEGWNMIGWLGA